MASKNPTELAGQTQLILTERKQVIQQLAMQGKRAKTVLDQDVEPQKSLFQRLNTFLIWLDKTVTMSPELKQETKIDEALNIITQEPFHFPDDIKTKALALMEKWQGENWGRPAPAVQPAQNGHQGRAGGSDSEESENDERPANGRRASRSTAPATRGMIMSPPYDHPIWGRDGIMHGLALKRMEGGRKSKVLNPEYKHRQRSAKVYGHNDITVGRWFPFQLCAVFHGAHGAAQAGITPGPVGAYSIIVSGLYEDLDTDMGDKLFYSGSGSHDNTDPGRIATSTVATNSLHASIDSGNPVRVLRSHSGRSGYAPYKGLRYDGLYRVMGVRTPKNMKGGLYEQFRLERLEDDQISLDKCKVRPNGRDLRDYDMIEHGYPSRR